ncbi:hypothetical protein SUGI_0182050 [Cryptomeria japonica]|nr:hypothetical protein SUGI_0182050 [Cryptomeria japonica]
MENPLGEKAGIRFQYVLGMDYEEQRKAHQIQRDIEGMKVVDLDLWLHDDGEMELDFESDRGYSIGGKTQ